MEQALKRIIAARQAIWYDEPADVRRLADIKGARVQGASTVLFAATKLQTLITFLNHMRGVAKQGDVDLTTMVVVTEPYMSFHAGVYGNFYQFADTEKVVRWAIEALSEVETLEGYAELIGELAIYLNRMDYWVDLKITWASFGQVFEQETT